MARWLRWCINGCGRKQVIFNARGNQNKLGLYKCLACGRICTKQELIEARVW